MRTVGAVDSPAPSAAGKRQDIEWNEYVTMTTDGNPSLGAEDASERVAYRYSIDEAAKSLGIRLRSVTPGACEIELPAQPAMVNGEGLVHGGYTYLLADTCFAYTCEAAGRRSVTRQAEIVYVSPGREDSVLRATGTVRAAYGRNTIVDVAIRDADGVLIAEFRGHGVAVR